MPTAAVLNQSQNRWATFNVITMCLNTIAIIMAMVSTTVDTFAALGVNELSIIPSINTNSVDVIEAMKTNNAAIIPSIIVNSADIIEAVVAGGIDAGSCKD